MSLVLTAEAERKYRNYLKKRYGKDILGYGERTWV